MSGIAIAGIVLLVLIIVPIPLVWVISTIFPDGYTASHTQRIRRFISRERRRILVCGVFIAATFLFAPDYALQVILIGGAIFVGWVVAASRNR